MAVFPALEVGVAVGLGVVAGVNVWLEPETVEGVAVGLDVGQAVAVVEGDAVKVLFAASVKVNEGLIFF